MDDRNQSWRFSYDESSADNADDESWRRSSEHDVSSRRLSELLDKDEAAIARRMEAIDAAVESLRDFSGGTVRPKSLATPDAPPNREHARVTQPKGAGSAGDAGLGKPAETRVASPSNPQQAAPSAGRPEIAKPAISTGQSQSDARTVQIERAQPAVATRDAEPPQKQNGHMRVDAPPGKPAPDSERMPKPQASAPDGAGTKVAGAEKLNKSVAANGSPPSGTSTSETARNASAAPLAAGPAPAVEVHAEALPDKPHMRVDGEMKDNPKPPGMVTLEGDRGPIEARPQSPVGPPPTGGDNGRGGGGGGGGIFHRRLGPIEFGSSLAAGLKAVKRNLAVVLIFTVAGNVLVLAIPVYLFQISDRILTSRSEETLIMLTIVVVGAVVLQSVFDAVRRFILMRTAVEVAAQLGAPILGAAARASLHSNGKEYQTLGDLQQLRSFLTSGTLLSLLDAPMAPLFLLAVFLIHPHLGFIVVTASLVLLIITLINQRLTEKPFGEANAALSRANLHLDSMTRNSQVINALAMIPEAVRIWGRDTADSLRAQVIAQDRNITCASISKGVRLLTQVTLLGWGAFLAIEEHLTGGMVIAGSIIAGRALNPIEGAIEGWNQVVQSRSAYDRIASLLRASPLNLERLNLPRPEGRLDVERLLYVPQGTKRVVLNGVSFALNPGDSLAIIGNSGAGKTTLGKMLVGSILPTSGNVRLDLMDLRNWDQRQFGESIGYLPQDVQLFPASIKANIARMRDDVTDAQIYEAAKLADVHDMIATLPHGYETLVAADGAPLSGGQKQRVALARAFFGNPRLVVLDEPNSNLDAAGDAALAQALQHAKEQKITVITITQRPALLRSVDKILLLVSGAVALFGVRQDVLQALAQRGLSIEGGAFGHQLP